MIDPAGERDLLEAWSAGFEVTWGAAPVFEPFGDGLCRMRFPAVFDRLELIGGTGHFDHQPAMVAHVRGLGFDWEPGERVLTVPTPGSLNAQLEPGAGYRTTFLAAESDKLPLGPWLLRYLDGELPIHVCSADYYRDAVARAPSSLKRMHFHFASFVHDLSVHALNYHLIPHACIAEIRERIAVAMPERLLSWREAGATVPLTLTFFLDNDLNRYCYSIWCASREPAHFAEVFARSSNWGQLLGVLDTRIAETLRGVGDVLSGDTNHMAPLEPWSPQVRP